MPADPPLAGPLRSRLLSGNKRLQDCAQLDLQHVKPGAPAAEHVRLIQEALRQVAGASIPAAETSYGAATTAAVLAFKQSRTPPLFTRGTTQVDPITGIGTIRALDAELLKREAKPVPPPPPPPEEKGPRLVLSGQCQAVGQLLDNAGAPDMQFADPIAARKSGATIAICAPLTASDSAGLEGLMLGAMGAALAVTGGSSGADARVTAAGILMCNRFFKGGAGTPFTFAKGSAVSEAAKSDVGFLEFVGRLEFHLNRLVRAEWKAGLVDDRALAAKLKPIIEAPDFGTGQFSGQIAAFIGGFQGYKVELCRFTADTKAKTFSYSLDLEIFDHFGVDDSDIARPGGAGKLIGASMASFFVLQHDRAGLPQSLLFKNYRPFRITLAVATEPKTFSV